MILSINIIKNNTVDILVYINFLTILDFRVNSLLYFSVFISLTSIGNKEKYYPQIITKITIDRYSIYILISLILVMGFLPVISLVIFLHEILIASIILSF